MSSPHLEDIEDGHVIPHLSQLHAEVVKPETLAKWREWGVPEDIISRAIQQRQRMSQIREAEEWITLPHFAYKMPRLPEIEANAWGFAKIIDTEGTIAVRLTKRTDRTAKVDQWLYRYTYQRPRIAITTRTYELTEEIANMIHIGVIIRYPYDKNLKRRVLDYTAPAYTSRAVRICYLTEPYLTVPEKKKRATEILTIYKQRPAIRTA